MTSKWKKVIEIIENKENKIVIQNWLLQNNNIFNDLELLSLDIKIQKVILKNIEDITRTRKNYFKSYPNIFNCLIKQEDNTIVRESIRIMTNIAIGFFDKIVINLNYFIFELFSSKSTVIRWACAKLLVRLNEIDNKIFTNKHLNELKTIATQEVDKAIKKMLMSIINY